MLFHLSSRGEVTIESLPRWCQNVLDIWLAYSFSIAEWDSNRIAPWAALFLFWLTLSTNAMNFRAGTLLIVEWPSLTDCTRKLGKCLHSRRLWHLNQNFLHNLLGSLVLMWNTRFTGPSSPSILSAVLTTTSYCTSSMRLKIQQWKASFCGLSMQGGFCRTFGHKRKESLVP